MEVALVILDGWGVSRDFPGVSDGSGPARTAGRDAIAAAETPLFDSLLSRVAVGHLRADGETVGLPPGQMGNSQVGHLTIGAGQVVEQPASRIDLAIKEGTLGTNEAIASMVDHVRSTNRRLHLWGLLSDGGVHSSGEHMRELIHLAEEASVATSVHVVTDGRDTPPQSSRRFLAPLQYHIDRCEHIEVATVCGRYFAMDRDHNWERTRLAFDAMVHGVGIRRVEDAASAVEAAYSVGESDEFIAPTVIDGAHSMTEDDAVFMTNFRADRARQLTRMLADIDPAWPFDTDPPPLQITTMAEYDRTYDLPVAFEPIEPEVTLGSAIADAGLTQLRIAESEKYPHVTYFVNGGREDRYPGERREIVPSPPVATYDRQPEMSAPQVVDTAISIIEDEDPDVLVLNFANPDMVGHTGDFEATVEAIEVVDRELGRLLEHLRGAHVLVIADHGNAEDMGTPNNPHTAHTTNPVPCLYLDPDGDDGGRSIRRGGTLADVTPTLLELLEIEIPEVMTGRSLFE